MNKELIKITTDDKGQQLVSARELHEFLEIGTEFRKWFPRMCEYGFDVDVDYTMFLKKIQMKLNHFIMKINSKNYLIQ